MRRKYWRYCKAAPVGVQNGVKCIEVLYDAAGPHQLDAGHAAVAVLCAAAVTAARVQLLQRWPAFAEASERSNSQVMPQLGPLDIVWLAILPGFSEELLFRGALIPSLYPDW